MNTMKHLILTASILSLAACETGPSPAEQTQSLIAQNNMPALTASEIENTLVGNTIYTTGTYQGNTWEWAGYFQNGTMVGSRINSSNPKSSEGTWYVTDENKYCRTWEQHWGETKEGCYNLYRVSDTEIAFEAMSGTAETEMSTLKLGNPYEL